MTLSNTAISEPAAALYIDLLKRTLTASVYDESGWNIVDTPSPSASFLRHPITFIRQTLKRRIANTFSSRAICLVRRSQLNASVREEGRDWPLFGFSMAGHRRIENVQHCIENVITNGVPGDFIETGVWRGGMTIFMRGVLKAYGITDRTVWVADSFEGLPAPANEADGWDLSDVRYLKVSLEQVQENFRKFGLLDEHVKFLKGWFKDTLPVAPITRLAILRLDGDMYSSTMDALRSLYDKVSSGGYVIVDDYHSWPSCKQAVTDFLAEKKLSPIIQTIDWTGAFWQKP